MTLVTSTAKAGQLHGVKCLVYGKAGVGKTRLCATAPKPIIISAEGGLLSLRDQDIPVIIISTLEDLNAALIYLTGPGGNAYYTVCLDSISEIAEKILENAKKNTKDGRKAYGDMADQAWEVIRKFRDLPGKCVVMTAKLELVKDDATGTTYYGPSMPGRQLTNGLAYFFDEVFCLNTFKNASESFKALQTQQDLQYTAKDRSGALDFYEFPDLTNIFNKIYGVT